MSDTEVCRAASTARQSGDDAFVSMVNEEGERRSLSAGKCKTLIADSDRDTAIAAAAIIGIAVVAMASSQGGGNAPPPASNEEYAWRLNYNANRQPVWVCREVGSGEPEEAYHCQNLPKPGHGR